jgi:hypothetical protein
MPRAVLAAFLVTLTAGCTTLEVGHKFDLAAFEKRVQRGATTQAEVQSWLGAPASTGESIEASGERYRQWTYYHGLGRLTRMSEARFDILQVKFDERGLVRAYNWSGEAK